MILGDKSLISDVVLSQSSYIGLLSPIFIVY
jgi:hypothetical protein